jgi:hypothetical protein
MNLTNIDAGRFDIAKIAAALPETATTLLVDHYLPAGVCEYGE